MSDTPEAAASSPLPDAQTLQRARRIREDFARLMMEYQFAVDEVLTKVNILREEYRQLHRYNPIEHVSSRIKTPESLLRKVVRKECGPGIEEIREQITDIAGIRITCSFVGDTYRMLEALTTQSDVRVIEVKDYVAHPKPNGYKSLHAIIAIPVYLSTGAVHVTVEVQIRTVAMDFWASLEHKIFYKYEGDLPAHVAADLADAARAADELDVRMEALHTQVHGPVGSQHPDPQADDEEDLIRRLWEMSRAESPDGQTGR